MNLASGLKGVTGDVTPAVITTQFKQNEGTIFLSGGLAAGVRRDCDRHSPERLLRQLPDRCPERRRHDQEQRADRRVRAVQAAVARRPRPTAVPGSDTPGTAVRPLTTLQDGAVRGGTLGRVYVDAGGEDHPNGDACAQHCSRERHHDQARGHRRGADRRRRRRPRMADRRPRSARKPSSLGRYGVSRGAAGEAIRFVEHQEVARMRRGPRGGLIITEPDVDAVIDAVVLYLLRAETPSTKSSRRASSSRTSSSVLRVSTRLDEADLAPNTGARRRRGCGAGSDARTLHVLFADATQNPALEPCSSRC